MTYDDVELSREMVDQLRDDWNMTCLAAGIPAITLDTCARLMAVLYVHGNNEYMTHCPAFLADLRYIQKRFRIHGTGSPDPEFAEKNKLQGSIAVSRTGGVCSTRGIAQLLHSMAERAGVDAKKCHPHAFRHFFAKMYLKRSKTKDVTELADLLGHSGLDTTMIYIKRSQEEQKRMFNKNVDW